jgi:hypothetical protein
LRHSKLLNLLNTNIYKKKLKIYNLCKNNDKIALRGGFEPPLTAPKAAVLPLDDLRIMNLEPST